MHMAFNSMNSSSNIKFFSLSLLACCILHCQINYKIRSLVNIWIPSTTTEQRHVYLYIHNRVFPRGPKLEYKSLRVYIITRDMVRSTSFSALFEQNVPILSGFFGHIRIKNTSFISYIILIQKPENNI